MATETRIQGLDGLVERLRAFPKEMAKNGGPIRSALFKGAKIVKKAAQENVKRIVAEPNKDGLASKSTGTLEKHIVSSRQRRPQQRHPGASEVYTVRVRRGKYADGMPITKVGKAHEFGTEEIKPSAWLRRAASENVDEVFSTVAKELRTGIERVEKKLKASGT